MVTSPAGSQNESHSPSASSANNDTAPTKKRNTSVALDSNGNPRPVKRRAAKACSACRARKVRCDVMQSFHTGDDGGPQCSNCTMDRIQCVIVESKRRKKNLSNFPQSNGAATEHRTGSIEQQLQANLTAQTNFQNGMVNPSDVENDRRWSGSAKTDGLANDFIEPHAPHSLYASASGRLVTAQQLRVQSYIATSTPFDPVELINSASVSGDLTKTRLESPPSFQPNPPMKHLLPGYLKPLPPRMTSVDIDYLFAKGALSLPDKPLRNALLRAYIEYVHTYMPLVEIHEVLRMINDETGASGKISLLLFQAIMFAGTAFVDMVHLREFGTRKSARKAFFQKARVLYDFDYEVDRVSLVQSLLLMTYWYETPDDQKDTWHWMGVAISLAHTIGLHRNPDTSNMEPSKKKLWKRIWWSCFMRDRLVALGMRRPTRIKAEDYDVPMLQEEDFEVEVLSLDNNVISAECSLMRDVNAQRKLAKLCIAKAKLCLCISQVLGAQYSVLVKNQGMQEQEGNTRSSVMLFPKKLDQTDEVRKCDTELENWVNELPRDCQYSDEMETSNSGPPLFVQTSLLHMVYYTTLSALHRPQVLPSANTNQPGIAAEMQDLSRKKVREASKEITRMSRDLHAKGLEKYLPTTGVTVLLPAIIIHLLDIKSCNDEARQAAMDGFQQCMQVLQKLRDNYSSADFATQFLEAAIKKADIEMMVSTYKPPPTPRMQRPPQPQNDLSRMEAHYQKQAGLEARQRQMMDPSVFNTYESRATPPLDGEQAAHNGTITGTDGISYPQQNLGITSGTDALTPPEQETFKSISLVDPDQTQNPETDQYLSGGYDDMSEFLNLNDSYAVDMFSMDEGAIGESGGWMGDMSMGWDIPSRLPSPGPGDHGLGEDIAMGGVEASGDAMLVSVA